MPATSLRLHPADAIFVRMGARDHIMAGQSTFYVELAETAAMLHKATTRCGEVWGQCGRGKEWLRLRQCCTSKVTARCGGEV